MADGAEYEREQAGYARGIAEAIALIETPVTKDVDAVRATAAERWQRRQGT